MLSAVTPDHSANNAPLTLTLTGAGFDASTSVELVAGGGATYRAALREIDSFTQITATFAANSVPAGRFSVRVTQMDSDSAMVMNAFELFSVGEAKLETALIVPAQLGYHAVATIWVEYRNAGNAAVPALLLVLTATQNGREGAFLTLQQVGLVEGFWTSADPAGFSQSVQILASGDTPGMLQPGESVRVPVHYAGWQQPWDFSYPPINWNLGVLRADDTNRVDWAALKASMKPATINVEAWEVIWAGFTNQVGATWGDYVRMLDDNAAYLGRLGQRVVDVGQLLAFEFLQADGLSPLRTLASAVDAAVEAPGLPLVFSRFFPASISQRFEVGATGPRLVAQLAIRARGGWRRHGDGERSRRFAARVPAGQPVCWQILRPARRPRHAHAAGRRRFHAARDRRSAPCLPRGWQARLRGRPEWEPDYCGLLREPAHQPDALQRPIAANRLQRGGENPECHGPFGPPDHPDVRWGQSRQCAVLRRS